MTDYLPILLMLAQAVLVALGTVMSMAGAAGFILADPVDARRFTARHRAIAVNIAGLLLFYAGCMLLARMMMPPLA